MAIILLLEDNIQFARAVQRVLRGHEVRHVTRVDAAIDELQRPDVDCALIDLNLTDEDDYSGYEVLSYILHNRPDLPRAVVTGSRLKGAISKNILLRYGVGDIVIKGDVDRAGYGTTDLIDTVSDLLVGSDRRRREKARDEVASISLAAQTELRRRINGLQQLSEQLRSGAKRRDPTANSRTVLTRRADKLIELEAAAKARCDVVALDELAREVELFEAESARVLGDS
ncbi:response regulator [Nocardia colli]|uniref:Response regulator n=1 Tax=Nocardia colli TaxID=2545717 RepID=A0A5N0E6N0_9NOCA|nr:response regulator [Nocardia colli]KAA8883774.1 response regulator [Nocardia colli]